MAGVGQSNGGTAFGLSTEVPAAAVAFRRRHVLNLKASALRKGGGASTPYLGGETRTHAARAAHMVAASGGCLPDSPRS